MKEDWLLRWTLEMLGHWTTFIYHRIQFKFRLWHSMTSFTRSHYWPKHSQTFSLFENKTLNVTPAHLLVVNFCSQARQVNNCRMNTILIEWSECRVNCSAVFVHLRLMARSESHGRQWHRDRTRVPRFVPSSTITVINGLRHVVLGLLSALPPRQPRRAPGSVCTHEMGRRCQQRRQARGGLVLPPATVVFTFY